MFVIFIILVVTAIVFIGAAIMRSEDDPELWVMGAVFVLFVSLLPFSFSFKWQIGNSNLTGYVYQRSESFGYASYDLRYSQNAGQDNQPSFCVAAGSSEDLKLQKLVGQETKVSVTVPAAPIKFVNNPYECASYATFSEVK